jgi:hypothetical protein
MIVSLRYLFPADLIPPGQFAFFVIQIPDFLAFHIRLISSLEGLFAFSFERLDRAAGKNLPLLQRPDFSVPQG